MTRSFSRKICCVVLIMILSFASLQLLLIILSSKFCPKAVASLIAYSGLFFTFLQIVTQSNLSLSYSPDLTHYTKNVLYVCVCPNITRPQVCIATSTHPSESVNYCEDNIYVQKKSCCNQAVNIRFPNVVTLQLLTTNVYILSPFVYLTSL